MSMTQFVKPAQLDGEQLLAELATGGVVVTGRPTLGSDGFWLDIADSDIAKATPIVARHAAKAPAPSTLLEKLNDGEITLPELKALLA